jgi:electron transfer flavoprotein beta subunit
MKILVCISHVPDTTSKISFVSDGSSLDKNGVQFVINPYDEFGLTKGLHLREKHGGTVSVLTLGDESVEPTLRKALAIGADEAHRLNGVPRDGAQTSEEIAAFIRKNEFDVIICGQESIDYNGGVVPGALAAKLNLPFVNACIGLDIDGNNVKTIREIDGGKETAKTNLPIVIAGKKGLVEEHDLRIPNMRGIMTARSKSLSVHELIDSKSLAQSISFSKPPEKKEVKMISPDNLVELVRLLNEESKVI